MSAKAAYYDTGFGLIARGGADKSYTLDYVNGVGLGSYSDYIAIRPQKTLNVDGNYFFQGLGGNNELKFGFGVPHGDDGERQHYNGNMLVGVINGTGPGEQVAKVFRNRLVVNTAGSTGAVTSATCSARTASPSTWACAGTARPPRTSTARFRRTQPSPTCFPPSSPPATPRTSRTGARSRLGVGLSYAFDEARKTILRASYAGYYEQLSFGDGGRREPGRPELPGLRLERCERRQVRPAKRGGPRAASFTASTSTPRTPLRSRNPSTRSTATVTRSTTTSSSSASTVRSARTSRSEPPTPGARPTTGATVHASAAPAAAEITVGSCPVMGPETYAPGTPVTRNGFTGHPLARRTRPSSRPAAAARIRTNRPGYTTKFNGLELTLTKRLADKWMGRVAFSYNDWVENFDGIPTSATTANAGSPGAIETDALVDGGQVADTLRRLGQGQLLHERQVAALRHGPRAASLGLRPVRRRLRPAGRPLPEERPHFGRPGRHATLVCPGRDRPGSLRHPLELRPAPGQELPAGRQLDRDPQRRAVQRVQQQPRALAVRAMRTVRPSRTRPAGRPPEWAASRRSSARASSGSARASPSSRSPYASHHGPGAFPRGRFRSGAG